MRGLLIVSVLAAVVVGGAASAQGIDCARARSRPEKAICAAPGLRALDREVGAAYAAAVARAPGQAAPLRDAALAWVRARDAACTPAPAQLDQCLATQMTRRLAELSPSAAPVVAPAPAVLREPAVPSAANPPPPSATVAPAIFRAARQMDADLLVTSGRNLTLGALGGPRR